MLKIAYLTNTLPYYRKGLYDKLFSFKEIDLHIYTQDSLPGINYTSIHTLYPKENIHIIKFKDFWGQKFTWHFLPFLKLYRDYDIIKIDGNPRIITHALIATIFRLLGKKVILYSMVHSYKNNRFNKFLRITWMRAFKYHLLYNDADLDELKKIGFANKLMGAYNNGLNQNIIDKQKLDWTDNEISIWRKQKGLVSNFDIICCGKILEGKYEILLDAIETISKEKPNIQCCMIGDGDALDYLKNLAKIKKIDNNIYFVGSIYAEEEIAPYFLNSKIFVHPTAVGLSINHAFGYGLPIITHNDKLQHGPEIVAFIEDVNGNTYINNDSSDLAVKILNLLKNEEKRKNMGIAAYNIIKENYNTDKMADRLLKLIMKVYND